MPDRIGIGGDVRTIEENASAARQHQRCDHADQGSLAGAIVSDQAYHAGAQRQRNIIDRPDSGWISLADVFNTQHGNRSLG